YKDGQLVGVSPVSTGDSEHVTPPGEFKVSQKNIDHESSLYGRIIDVTTGDVIVADADTRINKPGPDQEYQGAPMHYFLRFNGGIGMHAGHLPGYPASHGCVRLPRRMAQKFYENAEIGTPVLVE
ncbi:MAG: L,D-transpeptidase family protein, partial [Akkermansiaceae bacterium]|nr:L,D-transpeptidase family protein [Akkermansiaceae bacterium]